MRTCICLYYFINTAFFFNWFILSQFVDVIRSLLYVVYYFVCSLSVLLLCSRTLIVVDYCLLVVLLVSSTWVVASKGVTASAIPASSLFTI